ncbi:MAG TPA: class I SAM-dependent methyltransferase [Acidothermaceae bacterium]|jgi:demethylmenaquinone methyltransferase/2-methoxy-6-polyprenyl-1,4-benzoquinol methylase
MPTIEELRARARQHADRLGFTMSSDDETGRLLAVLASSVPRGGRVLELGTGVGFGTTAIVAGLGTRDDVRVVTVEGDEAVATAARDNQWPSFVEFVLGDIPELLPTLGAFDVVFADAQGGKWTALDRTIDAMKPGGFLLVDDMEKFEGGDPKLHAKQQEVTDTLLHHPQLTACEIAWSTGLILCGKRVIG